MPKSDVDEAEIPPPVNDAVITTDNDVTLTSSIQSQDKPDEDEPITITLNPSAAICFNTSSQDYNLDWPALPGTTTAILEVEPLSPETSSLKEDTADDDDTILDMQTDATPAQLEEDNAECDGANDILQNGDDDGPNQENFLEENVFDPPSSDLINDINFQQTELSPNLDATNDNLTTPSPYSFNLYQRQAHIYSEANLHPYPTLIHAHHSAPVIQPQALELPIQGQQLYFNLGDGSNLPLGPTSFGHGHFHHGVQIMPPFLPSQPPPLPFPQFQNHEMMHHPLQPQQMQMDGHHVDHLQPHQNAENSTLFQTFNVILPQPVYYGYPSPESDRLTHQHQNHCCCGGESSSTPGGSGGQCQCQSNESKEEEDEPPLLQVKIPSWAKLNLDEEENSCVYPLSSSGNRSSSRPRLVEYIGDQYHEKNPHTRRTILLNQRRSSDNEPIVFYRFYQFSCPCLGKVWFSPLHRAREGCYCRDCHKFVKPFGHIDGLTPYMGHELCYAKFQCHQCGRSWSCQKSRSNFPDNCFSCGTIVYPYYQVSHSVLRRKIVRQNDNGTIRFRNWTYSGSSSTSLEDDEEYQEIFGQGPLYFEKRVGGGGSPQSSHERSPTSTTIGSNKTTTSSEGGASARSASASNICLESGGAGQSLFGGNPLLGHSISDTVVVLGHYQHQRWTRSEALHALVGGGGGGGHGRIQGIRHHLHRK